MRSTQAILLRMLVDTEEQDTLRGTLRSVASDEERPFADEWSLLAQLRRLCREMDTAPPEPGETKD